MVVLEPLKRSLSGGSEQSSCSVSRMMASAASSLKNPAFWLGGGSPSAPRARAAAASGCGIPQPPDPSKPMHSRTEASPAPPLSSSVKFLVVPAASSATKVAPAVRVVFVQVPCGALWKMPSSPPVMLQPMLALPVPLPMSAEMTATWRSGRPPGSAARVWAKTGICVMNFCCAEAMVASSMTKRTSSLRLWTSVPLRSLGPLPSGLASTPPSDFAAEPPHAPQVRATSQANRKLFVRDDVSIRRSPWSQGQPAIGTPGGQVAQRYEKLRPALRGSPGSSARLKCETPSGQVMPSGGLKLQQGEVESWASQGG